MKQPGSKVPHLHVSEPERYISPGCREKISARAGGLRVRFFSAIILIAIMAIILMETGGYPGRRKCTGRSEGEREAERKHVKG
jgi:hypothetical protein